MSDPTSPLAATVSVATAFLGNGILLAAVSGFAVLAWRQGFFLVTVVGLGLLLSFLVALASSGEIAALLVDVDVPVRHATSLAYFLCFSTLVLACRMLVGRWVPDQAVWNGSLLGRGLGLAMGILAGIILAGSLLVGWSMAVVPAAVTLQPRDLALDAGAAMLKVFGRFVERDRIRRQSLLGGWDRFAGDRPMLQPSCSEPFVDANANAVRDEDERYLDIDGDGAFTPLMPPSGAGPAGGDRWLPGLLDLYALASWDRVTASHDPRLTSAETAEVEAAAILDGLYLATASDPDPGDSITFAIKQPAVEGVSELTIEADSGRVLLSEEAAAALRPEYSFTVVAKDRSGRMAEQAVTVSVLGLPEPEASGSSPGP